MDLRQIKKKLVTEKKVLVTRYNVKAISIFGSYARGEQKKSSDLDLLVKFNDHATLFDLVGLGDYLEKRLRQKVDIVSEGGVRRELKESILDEAVRV